MAVKRTTDGITTKYADDGETYNNNLNGTGGNDQLVVDNNSTLNFSIYAGNGIDSVLVDSGGIVTGSILSNNPDGLGDTINVTESGTVLNSVFTGNGNDNVTLAGAIGNSQSDRISTGQGEDSLTIASTANVNVLQIYMASGGNTLTVEGGAQVSLRPSSYGAGIYTVAGDDTLYLGGTFSNGIGNDVDTHQGSDTVILGIDFSFTSLTGGDGEFLIMGGNDSSGSDADTLHIGFIQDRIVEHVVDDNPENGTITLNDGSVIRYTGFEKVVTCFARGTRIITAAKECAIEELCRNDLVLTLDNGLQPIRWIGSRKLSTVEMEAEPSLRPIRIRAGALGKNKPESDLVVSPQHRILVRSKIAQRMFSTDEVLVAAKHLLDIDGIDLAEDIKEVEYFHMLFDRHEIVISNGTETESLYTGPQALKALSPAARKEIFSLFPELQQRPLDSTTRPPARTLVPGRLGRQLAKRHSKNKHELVRDAGAMPEN